MPGYLSEDIICSETRTVFRERSSRKTVSFEEQIMSKDKYPSIFLRQMEAIVFIILQIIQTKPLNFGGLFNTLKRLTNSVDVQNIFILFKMSISI